MEENLNFKNAYQKFCRESTDILTEYGRITRLNSFLDIIIAEYISTSILISNNSKVKVDELTFQYDEGECENQGSQFIVSIERHISQTISDKPLCYGVKYCFEPSIISKTGSIYLKCSERIGIKKWMDEVRNSPGFVLAEGAKFSTLGIILERPKK